MTPEIFISEENLVLIEQLSAANYSFQEMAIYLNIPIKYFIAEAKSKDSTVWLAIQRGRLKSSFKILQKLQQNAEAGNITNIQQLEKMKDDKHSENIKQRIFYGED